MKRTVALWLILALLAGCGTLAAPPAIPADPPTTSVSPAASTSSAASVPAAPSMPPADQPAPVPESKPVESPFPMPPGAEHPVGVVAQAAMPTIPLADGLLLQLDLPIKKIEQIQQLLFLDSNRLLLQYQTDETYDDSGSIRNRCYIARIDLDTGRVVNRFGGNALAPLLYPGPDGSGLQVIMPDAIFDLDLSLGNFSSRSTADDTAYRKRMTETGGVGCFPENDPFVSTGDRSFRLAAEQPEDDSNTRPSEYRSSFTVTLPEGCSPIRFAGSPSWVAVVTVKDSKPYLLRDCKQLPTAQAQKIAFSSENLPLRTQYPAYRITDLRIELELMNWNLQAVQLGPYFYLEQWRDGGWYYYYFTPDSPGELDNPGVQFPVYPDETRQLGAYIGAAHKDGSMPAGNYRLSIPYGKRADQLLQAEFALVDSTLERPVSGRVTLSVKDPVIKGDADKVPFTIQNHTSYDMAYGMGVGLERYLDGKWQAVPSLEPISVPSIAVGLAAQQSNEDWLDLTLYARPLTAGRYRISKDVGEQLYADFEVKP